MNEPSRPIKKLKTLALNQGDTNAYYELEIAYLDYEHGAFYEYAKQMADRHNYPRAYYDTYIQLLESTGNPEATMSLDSCDENTKKLAIKYLQKASDLGFKPATEELSVIQQTPSCTFNLNESFKVISFNLNHNTSSSDTDTIKCNSWILIEENLNHIIKNSRFIEGQEWHYLFSHLPCQYEGEIKQDSNSFKFSLNSGAWGTIESNDSTYFFGIFDKKFDKYFHSTVWREEN